jgi:glycosyltransferase involved in cell wall biosynthesis
MLRALREAGATVRVLCLDRGAFWEEPIRELGVPVIWVGQSRSRLIRLVRMIKELRQVRPDVIQCQHFYTNSYGCVAGWLLKRPAIGAIRSNGRFDFLSCGRLGGRMNLRFPTILAGNSRSGLAYALRQGVPESRLFFIPNGVDTDLFKPSAQAPLPPLKLLAAGRLAREKRFDRFLEILRRLRHQHRLDVRGLLAGAARSNKKIPRRLEKLASSFGLLPEGMQFLGRIADMRPIYQQAAIFVLTSDSEGTPNVLLESMASGLPVVATSVGGVPEIVQPGQTGFLFPPDDLDGLTTGVLELVCRADLRARMGARARAVVEDRHSVHQLPVHLCRLYQAAFRLSSKPDANQLDFEEPVRALERPASTIPRSTSRSLAPFSPSNTKIL